MIDQNIQEIDKQYRAYENIVSIDDIEKADKSSLLGGIEEKTMKNYLSGQVPSKEHSDITLTSRDFYTSIK